MRNVSGMLVLFVPFGITSASDFPPYPYGCSMQAVDIAAEGPQFDALAVLRQGKGIPSLAKRQKEALSLLQRSGSATSVTLTLRGYKGDNPDKQQVNQDRAMLIRPYRIFPQEEQKESGSNDASVLPAQLLGVFDGHGNGGEKTSQHALEQVPKLLTSKLSIIAGDDVRKLLDEEEAVINALKEVFLEVDMTDPTEGEAGCTASIVLQLGPKIYVANAGDSVSFIGVFLGIQNYQTTTTGDVKKSPPQDQVRIVYRTREDKPDLPEERARILAAGGYVHIPPNPDDDVPRAYHVDEEGRMFWGLAMSRSIGDWKIQGVIAEPIVDVLDVGDIIETALAGHAETCVANDKSKDENNSEGVRYCDAIDPSNVHVFAVSATDGMMDELPPNFIGSVLGRSFFDTDITVHPLTAAERLILESAKGWDRLYNGSYRDDIAVSAATIFSDGSILSISKKR